MKNLFVIISISAILLSSCGGNSSTKMGDAKASIDITPDKLSVKLDPVCGMSMEQTPIADTLTYNGKLYGFCHSGCKEDFKKDPESYLVKLAN